MIVILGAGLSGLSASYHIGHEKCLILEKQLHPFGHLRSDLRAGFTWDQGPHVSFTKHDYVRDLFVENVNGEFDEYEVKTTNYFQGHWIDHPAQSSLYQIPEPLRSRCLESFLESRSHSHKESSPKNYKEWLEQALGPVFTATFPAAYTRKYWTREAQDMTVDWVGKRVFLPKVEDVIAGSQGPLDRQTHYITSVRYPRSGGYQSFVTKLTDGAHIRLGAEVVRIDLDKRKVWTAQGECFSYTHLINTLPLPLFVSLCIQATDLAREAANQLSCSQLLLVNITAPHPTVRSENWMYIYDEDKLSTRINCTEKLTRRNAPDRNTGVQIEVYFSRHRPLTGTPHSITKKVISELIEMELVENEAVKDGLVDTHVVYSPWANVIFDHDTKPSLNVIWSWLEKYGLKREVDDLHPLTDWDQKTTHSAGTIVMAGRFGQWKYFWTDDCVLRGKTLGELAIS